MTAFDHGLEASTESKAALHFSTLVWLLSINSLASPTLIRLVVCFCCTLNCPFVVLGICRYWALSSSHLPTYHGHFDWGYSVCASWAVQLCTVRPLCTVITGRSFESCCSMCWLTRHTDSSSVQSESHLICTLMATRNHVSTHSPKCSAVQKARPSAALCRCSTLSTQYGCSSWCPCWCERGHCLWLWHACTR